MPNIASVLKAEITRLSRKESRESSDHLKKALNAQRVEIASLKRRVQALESMVKRLGKSGGAARAPDRNPAVGEPVETARSGMRFSAKGIATNRKRLGLSAADFGLLIGTSGQTVYAWEARKSKPRPEALAAIAALRGIGKREVDNRLAKLRA